MYIDIDIDTPMMIWEDNQATIVILKKGYSPKLRHISKVHKMNLGSINEVISQEDVEIDWEKGVDISEDTNWDAEDSDKEESD